MALASLPGYRDWFQRRHHYITPATYECAYCAQTQDAKYCRCKRCGFGNAELLLYFSHTEPAYGEQGGICHRLRFVINPAEAKSYVERFENKETV